MVYCNRCDFENANQSIYCAKCGTKLNNEQSSEVPSSAYLPDINDNMDYLSGQAASSQMYQMQKIVIPHSNKRNLFSIILVTIVFCIGALISSFGLIGGLVAFINASFAVPPGLFLFVASIIVLVILLTVHKVSLLRWWQKLLIIFAATGVASIATIVEYAVIGLDKNKPITYLIFGIILLLYGIAIEVIAIW